MQIKKSFILLALVQTGLCFPLMFGFIDLISHFITETLSRRGIEGPAGHVARDLHMLADVKVDAPAVERREPEPAPEPFAELDESLIEARQACPPVPAGVPSNVIANCCNALRGKRLRINKINAGKAFPDIRIQLIPYACISAAPWLDGISQQNGATPPFACGDDCLQWTNLNQQRYNQVLDAWRAKRG